MKIICIGRNYALHALEHSVEVPAEPVFFMKPDTALSINNRPFYLPAFSTRVEYECEVVVRIDRVGRSIDERFAPRYYSQIGLGIDFTARDLQQAAIARGLPWEAAKAFDHSAAVSARFLPFASDARFEMLLNGERRQAAALSDAVFSVDRLIAHVSRFVTLRMGDLIFTGTPAGVGAVTAGDRIEGYLQGEKLLDFEIR